MGPGSATTRLERRKQVRLRLREDLEIAPQTYEGRTYHLIKDPVSLRYYRFDEQNYFLLERLNGTHTLDDIQQAFEARYRPKRMTLEELESFAQQLLKAGLIHNEAPQAGQQLYDRHRQGVLQKRWRALSNILYIKVPVVDPDRLLDWLVRPLRWLYTPWFGLLSLGIVLAALLLVGVHFDTFYRKLPSAAAFFTYQNILYLWLAIGTVKIIHEFGHGLSCKFFGGDVHEMGLLFFCFAPSLFCNVSDAWTIPSKWRRIAISFAGIYVELMIASLATFLWWQTTDATLVHQLSLSLMMVCGFSTVVMNANPLMRYDGYYVLLDWLEIPNLSSRANQYLKQLAQQYCLGMEVPAAAYMAPGRQVLFVLYAVASYLYRWVVTFSILWFLYNFLPPRLRTLSALLALASAGMMVGTPLHALGKMMVKKGRLPDMKQRRVAGTMVVLAVLVLAFFFLPLPVSRVREAAVVQLRPDAVENVYVDLPGILLQLHVREGQAVLPGDILARFRSLELESQLEEARSQYDIRTLQADLLRQQADATTDPQERAKLGAALAAALGERNLYGQQIALNQELMQRLTLRAARPGVVLGLPRKEEARRLWSKDPEQPFCRIGNPRGVQAVVPVAPADHHLLKGDLAAARHGGGDLLATVGVQGQEGKTWAGRIAYLPESEAAALPLALTTQGGGPVPARSGTNPDTLVPLSQQYLVYVTFEPDAPVLPGNRAYVKIHCRWRPAAWLVWRIFWTSFG